MDQAKHIVSKERSAPDEKDQSPDIIVKDYNVYLIDKGGKETRLSETGTKESPFDDHKDYIKTSPDGRWAVVWQFTPGFTRKLTLISSSPNDQLQPRVKEIDYPKPGDDVPLERPRFFDLVNKKQIFISEDLYKNPYEVRDVGWSKDSQRYHFLYNERGHKVLRVISICIDGTVETLLEEKSDTFIDHQSKIGWKLLDDTDEMVWQSERTGWNHVYLYNTKTRELKNAITQGEWNVRSIDRIDRKTRQLWMEISGAIPEQDPYFRHLARVNLDGSGFTILTADGDGNHRWEWKPDYEAFKDTWARVDQGPESVLRDAAGKVIQQLSKQNLDEVVPKHWSVPERFDAPGRDGKTGIYGIIIRPLDFDPAKRYPILEDIYAGPGGFNVPKTYSRVSEQDQSLARLGFVVVLIDGMGTNWRGKAFQDVCYKNLKDAGFPDRVAWIKAAAQTRPWMDLSRVGIFGTSAGGQNAMGALLWHGDFYKAGIADAGCHDNRIDKQWWNEQWMGWPVDESYEDSSNVVHAHKLNGSLLLMVGELDDNVDPASTFQVINALNKAEKDYEFIFVPGAGHGVARHSKYILRRIHQFWLRTLMSGIAAGDEDTAHAAA